MSKEDICYMSACDMADAIKRQELTSQEITETIIERIEKINPIINAYCTPTFELAREMAKKADDAVKKGEKLGLLNGIPTSIKDLVDTKGIRTTYGCKIYENFIPDEDDIVVQRLKEAGVVILGKTNTPSFGSMGVTDNLIFGETLNPWNLKKTPGGSSGGAAAAVASGLGPLALGSDGGGSVRVPSSFCNLYGLKPSFGRIPKPHIRMAFDLHSHYGPLVRYVKDAALMLDVMSGPDDADRYSLPKQNISYLKALEQKPKELKIGYSLDLGFVKAIEPDVKECVLNAVKKFESYNSWSVKEAKIKIKDPYSAISALITTGYAYDFKPYLKKWRDKLSPNLVRLIDAGPQFNTSLLLRAMQERKKIYEIMYQYFKNYDILITPTTACPAFESGIMSPPKINDKAVTPLGAIPYTAPFNMTGHPAASIPCGWSKEELPIGMHIVGKRFADITVLQVSKAFEEIAPWQDKKPQFN